jgi:hypothetical protein
VLTENDEIEGNLSTPDAIFENDSGDQVFSVGLV